MKINKEQLEVIEKRFDNISQILLAILGELEKKSNKETTITNDNGKMIIVTK